MKNRQSVTQRVISVLLAMALLIGLAPQGLLPVAAADSRRSNPVADPSTMDSWKHFFPIDGTISTENAGGV